MKAPSIDWTKFRKRITIGKLPSEVYSAWVTQSKMETWFLESSQFFHQSGQARDPDEPFQKGDTYVWKWNNWDIKEKGEIKEANGQNRISFTFGKGGLVHVELKGSKDGTEVILTQENIPFDEKGKMDFYVGCSTGWTFWLANLKAWMEHGVLLQAKGLSQEDTNDLVNS